MNKFYVYILASQKNGTIYIGFTNDLKRRILDHKEKAVKGFTEKYNVTILVYFEEFENSEDAILREKQLKKWKRAWKLKLIDKENSSWNDLSKEWYK